MKDNSKKYSAINWNKISDQYSKIFWDQNVRQFWVDEEIPLSADKLTWQTKINDEEKDIFEKVLTGLTLLDTYQGNVGMVKLCENVPNVHAKAVIQFMGMMEQMHAKSYSSIFSTLSKSERIDELFEWVQNEPYLQKKLGIILSYYQNIYNEEDLYLAMAASVFLETFLFYSGFFYPLLLSGQGLMVNSAEIINLIIRDESVHGLFIGSLAQEIFKTFSEEKKSSLHLQVIRLLNELMEIEVLYTKSLYSKIHLVDDVIAFVKHNANKAMNNLGFDEEYEVSIKDVNPIVLNGLKTTTKNHDFFSTKGNGYIKATKVEDLTDEDFIF